MATYATTPSGDIVLMLTKAEARGLAACADEGAEGLLNDAVAARGYLGAPSAVEAAKRALNALGQAAAN
jgi:hypothetical protein